MSTPSEDLRYPRMRTMPESSHYMSFKSCNRKNQIKSYLNQILNSFGQALTIPQFEGGSWLPSLLLNCPLQTFLSFIDDVPMESASVGRTGHHGAGSIRD